MERWLLGRFVLIVLYLTTAMMVLIVFHVRPGINGFSHAMFADMVYGRAYKPYVSRVLVPITVRAVTQTTPHSVKQYLTTSLQNRGLVKTLKWKPEYLFEYLVTSVLMLLCLVLFGLVLRRLVAEFYDFPSFIADYSPLGALVALPIFFRYHNYIYDPGTLLFYTLAVMLIVTRKHLWLYPIFALATLNKETSVLLVVLFFIRERGVLNRPALIGHLVLQMSIWIGLQGLLAFLFWGNPGSFLRLRLVDHNLALISAPYKLIYTVAVVAIFWVLIRDGWAEKPAFLRHGLAVTLAPLVLLSLFIGYVDELRGYYEAFPFLFLLSLPAVVGLSETRPRPIFRSPLQRQNPF